MRLDDPAIPNQIMPALQRIGSALLRCVVPIFCRKGSRVTQEGCGFLVAQGSNYFLVTAAHVIRQKINENVLCISLGGKRLRGIDGRYLLTPGPGVPIAKDEIDVAVVMLEGSHLPPYPDVDKYPLEATALMAKSPRGTGQFNYHVAGFPETKGGFDRSRNEFTYQPYSYTNIEAESVAYKGAKADVAKHIAVTFNQKRGIGPSGNVQTFPFPYGMSGSPLWLLANGQPIIPVVGVVTRWCKPHIVFVATEIWFALAMLDRLTRVAHTSA